jgi:transposase
MHFHRSVDRERFVLFLEKLRSIYPKEKLTLFMDRLAVHRSDIVQDKMKELKLGCIFNASYSPDFNPIEGVFSIVKQKIKQQRLRALAKGQQTNI